MDTLAKRLKYCRLRARLTQAEVAARTGIKQPVYCRLENGGHLKTGSITQLAHLYGVDAHWLATGNKADASTSFGLPSDLFQYGAITA